MRRFTALFLALSLAFALAPATFASADDYESPYDTTQFFIRAGTDGRMSSTNVSDVTVVFTPCGSAAPEDDDGGIFFESIIDNPTYYDSLPVPDGDYVLYVFKDDEPYRSVNLHRFRNGKVAAVYDGTVYRGKKPTGEYLDRFPEFKVERLYLSPMSALHPYVSFSYPQQDLEVTFNVRSLETSSIVKTVTFKTYDYMWSQLESRKPYSFNILYNSDLKRYNNQTADFEIEVPYPSPDGRYFAEIIVKDGDKVLTERSGNGFVLRDNLHPAVNYFELDDLGDISPAQFVAPLEPAGNASRIELLSEELTLDGIDPTHFSVDGGKTWKEFNSNTWKYGTVISKLIDKGMTLWFAEGTFDKKAKTFGEGVKYVKFPPFAKRPNAPNYDVNYLAAHIKNGKLDYSVQQDRDNYWTLTAKNSDEPVYAGLQISAVPDNLGYFWSDLTGQGVRVKPLGMAVDKNGNVKADKDGNPTAAVKKTSYFVRTSPVVGETITPVSKTKKYVVSGLTLPKFAKFDYQKETIKFQKDTYFTSDFVKTSVITPEQSKTGITLTEELYHVYYCMPPTRKAPASSIVYQMTPQRAGPYDFELSAAKGAVVYDKILEFSYDGGKKWGAFKKPAGEQAGEILVRSKNTAKLGKPIFDGDYFRIEENLDYFKIGKVEYPPALASYPAKFVYTWGDWGGAKPGVVEASIIERA